MVTWLFYLALACAVPTTQACNALRSLWSRPSTEGDRSPPLIEKLQDTRYILIWTGPKYDPMIVLGEGSSAFKKHQCAYTNCFVTSNRRLLKNLTEFDAVLFNGKYLSSELPKERSMKQKYVYSTWESSHYYPVCDDRYNGFFNWTWTYKLNSDFNKACLYPKVCDLKGSEVGPRIDMHWSEQGAVDNETKIRLQNKSIAAAWFVSNCGGKSGRLQFVRTTIEELKKYGHTIHIYGSCGTRTCPMNSEECNRMLANDYFFYFAFENSFAEDYVTEKVLTALKNYAVPVVYGAANYSRFLPPGSYLNARALGPAALAARMAALIANYKRGRRDAYYDFFRWRSRYSMEYVTDKEYVCQICADLNNPEKMSKQTVYKNFTKWWNSDHAICTRKADDNISQSIMSRLLKAIQAEMKLVKSHLLYWLYFLEP